MIEGFLPSFHIYKDSIPTEPLLLLLCFLKVFVPTMIKAPLRRNVPPHANGGGAKLNDGKMSNSFKMADNKSRWSRNAGKTPNKCDVKSCVWNLGSKQKR